VGQSSDNAREQVESDAQGRVRRVRRVYHTAGQATQVAGQAVCSIVPAKAVHAVQFDSLDALRNQLASRGLLTSDLPLLCDSVNLAEATGVLRWIDATLDEVLLDAHPGLTTVRPGVVAGTNCDVAESARLVGPVVLQDGAAVEPDATVVGPVMIGAGARIGARAVVSRSLLLAGSVIDPDTGACSEVIAGRRRASDEAAPLESQGLGQPGTTPPAGEPIREADPCVTRNLAVADLPAQRHSRRYRVQQTIKRGLDAALAAIGLAVLSPLLLIVGALVKLTSPGPLFFIHQREGRNGREFGCIKFRTMVADAHLKQREMYDQNQVDGPQFKIENDPRVTLLGAFLRASNLDELPQLINVLLGQMSLVGPRPSPFRENQICVSWRRARLSVTPGITGIWQICRDRKVDGDFHQWIYYDLIYVRHFSLWLDLKILFWTILSLGGKRRVSLRRLVPSEPDEEQCQADSGRKNSSTGSTNGRHRQPAA
jgi:lipopolysaccharide/colanic/teichoic acid biosynthesis glycosyltransferase